MIKNPNCGWCSFNIGDFKGTPSYLTNVPLDLLQAFIDLHMNACGCAWFDEEGTEFTLVINPYNVFIIEERKEQPVLHCFPDLTINDLEKELINDIESDLVGWSYFTTDEHTNEEVKLQREQLIEKISILKKYK